MTKARFVDIDITDVTSDFLITARAWQSSFSRHASAVKEAIGEKSWEERQASRAQLVRSVEDGLLRRLVVSGRAR